MPPFARLSTVEYRSLLLPPIRIPLRSLHTYARPECASFALCRAPAVAMCHIQRRSLHLYKTARAKTVLGMHKLLDFNFWDVKPPSESTHKVNLVKYKAGKDPVVIEKDLSLKDLLDKHVKPGNMLVLVDSISKKTAVDLGRMRDEDVPTMAKNYAIVESRSFVMDVKCPQTMGKQLGKQRNIMLLLSNPVEYRKLAMNRAYKFIEHGSPVEFRIRFAGSALAVQSRGKAPPGSEGLDWIYDHFPHLRPDFILQSMPEGTRFLIPPVSDGRVVQFVLAKTAKEMRRLPFDERLFRVKAALKATLPANPMAQRHQYNQVRMSGNTIKDGDGVRQMSEEEIAKRNWVREAARDPQQLSFFQPDGNAMPKRQTDRWIQRGKVKKKDKYSLW